MTARPVQEALLPGELNGSDAILFDPPRAGTREQCLRIADNDVPVVVAVACNAATFAQDARILINGGYSVERVAPIDRFMFSPHIELVAVFTKR